MRENKPPVPFGLVSSAGTSPPSQTFEDDIHTQATKRDLLLYMGDLLSELETIASKAAMDGLADLLGYAQREVERNRKMQLPDTQN